MYELELAVPIYLTSQLAKMTEATGFTMYQLYHLAGYGLPRLATP